MSVAVANEFVQNAERPGGNRGELNDETSALQGVQQDGKRDCPHSAHALGRSKRDVPMSQDHNGFRWRSPSGWHDSAMGRDAGHDDMQLAIFDYLQDDADHRWRTSTGYFKKTIHVEYPLIIRGNPVAFADIMNIWNTYVDDKLAESYYEIYEIKPVIHSIGAIIRQCTALELIARKALADPNSGKEADVRVILVVKSTDPKLAALRQVYEPWTWDGGDLNGPEDAP